MNSPSRCFRATKMHMSVAQLAERRSPKPQARSSTPLRHPKFKRLSADPPCVETVSGALAQRCVGALAFRACSSGSTSFSAVNARGSTFAKTPGTLSPHLIQEHGPEITDPSGRKARTITTPHDSIGGPTQKCVSNQPLAPCSRRQFREHPSQRTS